MTTTAEGRRSLVAVVAIALACLLALGSSPAAGAATVTGPVQGLDITAIDPDRTVDPTIRLTPHNPFDDVRPGELPPGGIAGTTFTVRRVAGIDLTTEAGWARARALTVREAREGPFDHTSSWTTGPDGTVTVAGLPVCRSGCIS